MISISWTVNDHYFILSQHLESLNDEAEAPRVPDGVGLDSSRRLLSITDYNNELMLSTDNSTCNTQNNQSQSACNPDKELLNPISCYICKKPYVRLHFFYHQLCPDCAEFNYSKRNEVGNCNLFWVSLDPYKCFILLSILIPVIYAMCAYSAV